MTAPRSTSRLALTKHHGLGNDFLCAMVEDPSAWPAAALAKQWCDRRRGVGADGLILIGPPPAQAVSGASPAEVDVTMVLHNADGSRAEMSGNGVRCLAQAVVMQRGTDRAELVVATDAGPRRLQVTPHPGDPATVDVRVGMGPVRPGPKWQPSRAVRAVLASESAVGEHGRVSTADIGNPHLIIEVADPWRVDLGRIGPLIEADFPAGINVHFVAAQPDRPDQLELTVWERGAGITEACGTGAAAAATIAHRWALVGAEVEVRMPGGSVTVIVGDEQTELIGPATFIARLEVDLG